MANFNSVQLGNVVATPPVRNKFNQDGGRVRIKEFVYSQTYCRVPYSSVNFVNFAYYEYAVARRLVTPERIRFVGRL